MGTIKIQLDIPKDLIARLDAQAEKLRAKEPRQMSQFEWITRTAEGRTVFHAATTNPVTKNWSEKQMNAHLQAEYRKSVSWENQSGRPALNKYRLAVIETALTLLEATNNGQD